MWLSILDLEKGHRRHKREVKDKNKDYRSQVVIPNVEGVMKKYGVATASPHHPQTPVGTSKRQGRVSRTR